MSLRESAAANEEDGGRLMDELQWKPAVLKLEEAARDLESYHEPLNKSRLEAKIGRCYVELRDYGAAHGRFERQLACALQHDATTGTERDEGRCVAHHNLGHALFLLGSHAKALDQLDEAATLLDELEMPEQKGRTASLAGVIHQMNNRLDAAISKHQTDHDASLKLARQNENDKGGPGATGVIRARHNIGACLLRLGKHARAREEFDACAAALDGLQVDELEALHKGATKKFALAKAFYHGAIATDLELDGGSLDRLERAAKLAPDRARNDRPRGPVRRHFETLELGHIDVDSADAWTSLFFSSSSPRRRHNSVSNTGEVASRSFVSRAGARPADHDPGERGAPGRARGGLARPPRGRHLGGAGPDRARALRAAPREAVRHRLQGLRPDLRAPRQREPLRARREAQVGRHRQHDRDARDPHLRRDAGLRAGHRGRP